MNVFLFPLTPINNAFFFSSSYELPDSHLADERVMEVLQDKANFRNFKPKPFNMKEFYDRAGHDIREMLLNCKFRGDECGPDDFVPVSFCFFLVFLCFLFFRLNCLDVSKQQRACIKYLLVSDTYDCSIHSMTNVPWCLFHPFISDIEKLYMVLWLIAFGQCLTWI